MSHTWKQPRPRSRWRWGARGAARLAFLVFVSGCGAPPPPREPEHEVRLGEVGNALSTGNGLITNGLITNGLATNGLITNGLAINGLTDDALANSTFADWFDSNTSSLSNSIMQHVVRCAVPEGQHRSWTRLDSQTYTWDGTLGLAPNWASGQPITETEQQLVSACMAALVNKFGVHVSISILGETALGTLIPLQDDELSMYSEREACFFGNLFNGEGLFVGNDHGNLNSRESSVRACGMGSQSSGTSVECPPIVHIGSCSSLCSANDSNTRYVRCTYNGKEYRPLTTRLRPRDIYTCGDGICQISESCGTGNTYDNCELDCGPCW